VRLVVAAGADQPAITGELSRSPLVRAVEAISDSEGNGWWLFPWRGRPILAEVAEMARLRGWPVTSLWSERGRLEDVFLDLTNPSQTVPRKLRSAA
jgi:hypothetical protein